MAALFDVIHMNLEPVEIRLNVYDLSTDLNENSFINTFGLGAFHSAIEFYGREVLADHADPRDEH